jgi:hypothetical protein
MTHSRTWLWLPLLGGLVGLAACAQPGDSKTAAAPQDAAAVLSQTVLSADGLGSVRIGMTPAEAEAALGAAIEPRGKGDAACWMTRRADGARSDVFYMVENGRITRIDVARLPGAASPMEPILSDKGIGIAATEDAVKAAYGDALIVQPHKYDATGHYLIVESADKKSALLFETAAGAVVTFRAGLHPSVDYVEACS